MTNIFFAFSAVQVFSIPMTLSMVACIYNLDSNLYYQKQRDCVAKRSCQQILDQAADAAVSLDSWFAWMASFLVNVIDCIEIENKKPGVLFVAVVVIKSFDASAPTILYVQLVECTNWMGHIQINNSNGQRFLFFPLVSAAWVKTTLSIEFCEQNCRRHTFFLGRIRNFEREPLEKMIARTDAIGNQNSPDRKEFSRESSELQKLHGIYQYIEGIYGIY